jgi:RNA polymerase I-specific transcription initiation factor RRN6
VSVLISSGKTLLINFYWFSAILDTTDRPTAFQGAFTLPTDLEQNPFQGSLQEVLLTPVSLVQSSSNSAAGPGLQYVKHDVKFYQLWALASDLGVWSTLCSIRSIGPGASYSPMLRITAPTTKISRSSNNLLSRHVVDDTFIVPDTFDGEKILDYGASDPVKDDERDVIRRQTVEDLRFRINWNKIFQHAFVKELHSDRKDSEWTISSHVSPTVAELLEKINDRINHGKQANCLGMTTL